jgi:gas vesicle protein
MREPEIRVGFTGSQMLCALLGGVAAGAAIMYFNAPRSGAQSRDRLRSMADGARDKVTRAPQAFREATQAAQRAFTETLAAELEKGEELARDRAGA